MIISHGNRQPFPELRGKLGAMRYPAYVEPKIDGELDWYKRDGFGPHLINKSGKIRYDFPVIDELRHIKHNLLGELHWGEGKAGDLYEFLKHQKDDELNFTVFDVDMPGPYEERRKWLSKHMIKTKHVDLIWTTGPCNKEQIMPEYEKWISEGYEGVVVKAADAPLIMGPCPWTKMKKREMIECMVSMVDTSLERIEIIHVAARIQCGVKVPDNIKRTLKVGDMVEIEHQGILSKGGLRHPVYIRKVGEK